MPHLWLLATDNNRWNSQRGLPIKIKINLPACNCFSTFALCVYGACAHVCPRVDVCEVGTKFNDTEISQPGLAIRLAPNIDSFNPVCYNFK